jgi:hypothetical protein
MKRLGVMSVVLAGCAFGGLSAATAADGCVDSKTTIEKMNTRSDFVEKLDGKTVENLKVAFEDQYKHPMGDADEALVFHRNDTPMIDYLVLFKGGCAFTGGPVEEEVIRKAVLKSHPPADAK